MKEEKPSQLLLSNLETTHDMDNCLNSDHLIGIRAKTAAEEVNRLRNWKRTRGMRPNHIA